jgi:D-3-phosphoglycerate dehydrogenase
VAKHKIAFTTSGMADTSVIERELGGLDYEMNVHVCTSPGETMEAVKGADVIIAYGTEFPREVVESIDTALAIVSSGHGFDKIDDATATEKGIMVTNTAGFCTEEVANHAMMLLLACAKKLVVLDWRTREGKWLAKEVRVEMVAGLNELASRSDFVSMHTPLNDETRHLVGAAFFKAMKPAAYLINTSRGGTADEQALIEALKAGEIAGAGIDVFEEEPASAGNPLFEMDNVIVTPHTAGLSTGAGERSQTILGQETARILQGTLPMSLVNPEVWANIPARLPATNA